MVGNDWGAAAGWHLSLLRPDRVKGLVTLNVPYFHRSHSYAAVEHFRQAFGEGCFICQFQVLYLYLYATCKLNMNQTHLEPNT